MIVPACRWNYADEDGNDKLNKKEYKFFLFPQLFTNLDGTGDRAGGGGIIVMEAFDNLDTDLNRRISQAEFMAQFHHRLVVVLVVETQRVFFINFCLPRVNRICAFLSVRKKGCGDGAMGKVKGLIREVKPGIYTITIYMQKLVDLAAILALQFIHGTPGHPDRAVINLDLAKRFLRVKKSAQ